MQFLRDFSSSIFRICNLFDVGELLRLVYCIIIKWKLITKSKFTYFMMVADNITTIKE